MKKYFSDCYLYIWGVIVIMMYMLPYFINGNNSYITIHDFLDSSVAHYHNIIKNGMFFSLGGNIPLMEDVDRMSVAFSTPFELKALIFYLLPTFWAILANMILVKTCAFMGMFLLLNRYLAPHNRFFNFIVSIIYSLIPFYVDYGISSAGIPLLSYAILNLKERKFILHSLLITFIYATYSSLALSGLFVCILLVIFFLALYYQERRMNQFILYALILLITVYFVVNWKMITGFFVPSEIISHRQEWINGQSFFGLTLSWLSKIMIGQYHAGEFIALPFVLIFVLVYVKYKSKYQKLNLYMTGLVLLVLLIIAGTYIKMVPMKLFVSFQFDRFYFLYTSLCFVLFAKALEVLLIEKRKILVTLSIMIATTCVMVRNKEYMINCLNLVGKEMAGKPTISQFYDETLFSNICKDLNVEQNYTTKVVSLGLFPAVAEYNGLWSLDGYMNSYSLNYKHKFRKVIEKELNKDDTLKSYFDDWGSRCYVFSEELKDTKYQNLCSKNSNLFVEHLDIDTNALKSLGCQYIFSAVEIRNCEKLGLSFVNSYSTPESYWNIQIYKLF